MSLLSKIPSLHFAAQILFCVILGTTIPGAVLQAAAAHSSNQLEEMT